MNKKEKNKILKEGFDLGYLRGYKEALKVVSKIVNTVKKELK